MIRKIFYILIALFITTVLANRVYADEFDASIYPHKLTYDENYIYIIVKDNDTLRSLAKTYLEDENRWKDIYNVNDLSNQYYLLSKDRLKIPRLDREKALKSLRLAEESFKLAKEAQADVYAPEEYTKADRLMNLAKEYFTEIKYNSCLKQGQESYSNFQKSIELANARAIIERKGKITFDKGSVQILRYKSEEWSYVNSGDLVTENDRLKTGDNSRCEITYDDGSISRINPNSEVLIKTLKKDKRNNGYLWRFQLYFGELKSKVAKLLQGKHHYRIETQSAVMSVRGTEFRTKNNSNNKSAVESLENSVEVESSIGAVTLKQNEGTIVEKDKPPLKPKELLLPPENVKPDNNYLTNINKPEFVWQSNKESNSYHFEISKEKKFNDIVYEDFIKNEKDNEISYRISNDLEDGLYFWHISSLDDLGLEGKFSGFKSFRIDTRRPELELRKPADNKIQRTQVVPVEGNTEKGAKVYVNDKEINVDSDGNFIKKLALPEGEHNILVKSYDEAGNFKSETRKIIIDKTPPKIISVSIPENITISKSRNIKVGVQIEKDSVLFINGKKIESNSKDIYISNIELRNGVNIINIAAYDIAGNRSSTLREIIFDKKNDFVIHNGYVFTRLGKISVTGFSFEEDEIIINDKHFDKGRFNFEQTVKQGENQLNIVLEQNVPDYYREEDIIKLKVDSLPPIVRDLQLGQGLAYQTLSGPVKVFAKVVDKESGLTDFGYVKIKEKSRLRNPRVTRIKMYYIPEEKGFVGYYKVLSWTGYVKYSIEITSVEFYDKMGNVQRTEFPEEVLYLEGRKIVGHK